MTHNLRFRKHKCDRFHTYVETQIQPCDCELGSGIKDKNGREIFEGDIVKVVFDDGDTDAGEVEFLYGHFRVLDEALDDLTYGCEVTVVD